ncbi:MAG: hypothetical protein CSA70_03120 [Rhodobacterales bacterium]|nr:MAG: hypothetical protein CSA70_03120 [Rhodobacterales bacterium]
MVRIVAHIGFHKTGTTSLQNFLARNHKELAEVFDYYGAGDFNGAGRLSHIYAQRPFPWRLHRFRHAFRQTLALMPDPVSGNIVISRENFSGVMPGHLDWRGQPVTSYKRAAKPLGRVVVSELRRRFGPDARVEILHTLRDQDRWLASVHGHLLRSIQLTQDLDAFRARFAHMPSLVEQAHSVARRAKADRSHIVLMEDYTSRTEGPAAAILDLFEIAPSLRQRLRPVPRANAGQSADLRAEFLHLNRAGLSHSALKAAKEALLRAEK